MKPMIAVAAIFVTGAVLAACGTQDSELAHDARSKLVGISELDLHRCAGPPAKVETIGRSVLESYEQKETLSSVAVALPSIGPLGGGGVNLSGGGSGTCTAIFELIDGKVVSIHYAGATSSGLGQLTICGPIVEHCITDGFAGGKGSQAVAK